MISAKYDWKIEKKAIDEAFLNLSEKEKLSPLVAELLFERGIRDEESLTKFLTADLSDLYDPYLLNDMEKAVARIRQAIENDETILVYGDYDADGMTASSIMKEALESLGAEILVYLPNRFTDGYGPNQSVYQYFIEQEKVSLIVTVDNGVAGHEAISYAQSQGVDVIVTDHHSMPATLPEAFAIIHPEHPAADYPFKHLAGCGVAFKLATALLETPPLEMLDLVAIGTIADMVSLTDENRILVRYGLKILAQTERIGLQELMNLSSITEDNLNEESVGFKIAPLLNALGRLDDPNPALELLTGFDEDEARELALIIDGKNEERKALVQAIYDEALGMVDENSPVQVLAKEGWHAGVLGIVAGRLLEKISQPVILLAISDGKAKGSARSLASIDIFDALSSHTEIFDAFGGHAGAAGMTLPVENLPQLKQVLSNYIYDKGLDKGQKNSLTIDADLSLSEVSLDLVNSLAKLAPFGMEYRQPVFRLTNLTVTQSKSMGKDKSHLKFRVEEDGVACDVVAFSMGHLQEEFLQAKNLELAVTLSVNDWNGQKTVQLMLVDARIDGLQLIDIRKKSASLPQGIPMLSETTISKSVVLLEVPEDDKDLKKLFAQREFEAIYFKNEIKNAYYLTGYGTREQFATFYKTIYQFPEFDVRYKLKGLAHYLKIPDILLVKMIQIFEELGFVAITDGVMRVNKEAEKREISESQIYQDLKKLVAFQEIMALGTPQEIYDYLTEQ